MEIKTVITNESDLSPEEYLNLSEREKINIESCRIIPPSLGQKGDFGKIRVNYRSPIYKVDFNGR